MRLAVGTRSEPTERSATGDVGLGWYEGRDRLRWVTTVMGAKGVRSVDGTDGARGARNGAGVGTTIKDRCTNAVADPNVTRVGRWPVWPDRKEGLAGPWLPPEGRGTWPDSRGVLYGD